MEETIKSLKSSPVFNISLSSKELFHSNFLAWLTEMYPESMWKVFSKYTDFESDKYLVDNKSVKREKNQIDLMFEIVEKDNLENRKKIIVENKVKSLPYINQLNEYAEKFPDACYILLSLSTPHHLINEDGIILGKNDAKWHLMTYSDLVDALEKVKFNYKTVADIDSKGNAAYHRMLIKDYIEFVKNLENINKITEIKIGEKFDWYGQIFENLNEIRLSDFYVKKKSENMAYKILENIKTKLPDSNIEDFKASSSIVQGSNGEFRIYYKFNRRITVSIEVSRMYYRKMVHLKNQEKTGSKIKRFNPKYEAFNVAEFFNDIGWFNFDHIIKQGIYEARNDYNKFWDTRYKQCLLTNENSVDEIISYFINDLKYILNKNDSIINEFK